MAKWRGLIFGMAAIAAGAAVAQQAVKLGPDTTVQVPVPTVGVLPAIVAKLLVSGP